MSLSDQYVPDRNLTRAIVAVKFRKRRRVAGAAVIVDRIHSTLTRFVNNLKGASKRRPNQEPNDGH